MKVLAHICCANCAVYPVMTMKRRGAEVRGFWFNPNIHPFTEYSNRLGSMKKLDVMWELDTLYRDEYGLREFLKNTAAEQARRCEYCYMVRLDAAASAAKSTGADAFTTTLLVSPYQKQGLIIEIGRVMQDRHDVEFLAEDFRPGFREGRRMARDMGFYNQKYCGCIFSEEERYLPSEGR
ncbi:MAG: epoxyqueuosine reductase QueH [Nitrospiraceae bacterium]|nr:epoxyqueuosine reductase QueH [Nitrospiraceae bacterium]